MSYFDFDERNQRSSSRHTEWVCLLVFVVFTFVYLYFYQADVLAAGQHVLSGGQTHYRRLVGAVLITLVLLILQRFIFHLTQLRKRAHALTYLPSLLVLTVITDVSSNIDLGFSFGGWLIAVPLIAVGYGFLVVLLRKMEPFEPQSTGSGFLSRTSWINLLTMVVMFLLVGLFSNGDTAFHYRMRMERLLLDGKNKEALRVGRKSEVTDPSLTMLRAYALAREGQLGNRFFEFPVTEATASLLPDGKKARVVIMPDSLITTDTRSALSNLEAYEEDQVQERASKMITDIRDRRLNNPRNILKIGAGPSWIVSEIETYKRVYKSKGGFSLSADYQHLWGSGIGIGANYLYYGTSFDDGFNIRMHYFGPSFVASLMLGQKWRWVSSFGVGYAHYKENITDSRLSAYANSAVSSGRVGVMIKTGFEYMLSKNVGIGLQIDYFVMSLKKPEGLGDKYDFYGIKRIEPQISFQYYL